MKMCSVFWSIFKKRMEKTQRLSLVSNMLHFLIIDKKSKRTFCILYSSNYTKLFNHYKSAFSEPYKSAIVLYYIIIILILSYTELFIEYLLCARYCTWQFWGWMWILCLNFHQLFCPLATCSPFLNLSFLICKWG